MKRPLIFILALAVWLPTGAMAKSSSKQSDTNYNAIASFSSLTGSYIALRHGESVPSSEKRICGSLKNGIDPKNGLTPKGREEVKQTSLEWVRLNKKVATDYLRQEKLVVVTSPFSRTQETAQIFVDTLQEQLNPVLPKKYRNGGLRKIIVVENDLRERDFGKFEGQGNSGQIYDQVWEEDRKNPGHTKWSVESANAVQQRASQVIAKLEQQSQAAGGKIFVLASHGDTLKILQTAFQKQSAAEHCNKDSVVPFKTAEFRQLKLSAGQVAQAGGSTTKTK